MFLRNKTRIRLIFILVTGAVFLAFAVGYLALQPISSRDSRLQRGLKLISKASIMRVLDKYEDYFGHATSIYAPTPFESLKFSYADLGDPYFEKIRNDNRVSYFYTNRSTPIDFYDAVAMADYLRDLFQHGESSKNYLNTNVIEMLDAVDQGEKLLCGDISKMLAQLAQAGGTQARLLGIWQSNDKGHVVVEVWSKQFKKWAVIDPDYNVHYTDSLGTPLSAFELYQIAQVDTQSKNVRRISGNSSNTLHNRNTKLIEQFYREGFAVQFYNKWVDINWPHRHPARSPSIMAYYMGKSVFRRLYFKQDSEIPTDDIISILYAAPLENRY